MENIYYAALALHVAGKPVSKENITSVLKAAGTPVNEPALEAMAAFVQALETRPEKNKTAFDPRVIKLLTAELAHQNVPAEKVEALLMELTGPASLAAVHGPNSKGRYIYGIANGGVIEELGQIGIEDNQVYTIPYRDICAVVHACDAEPYASNDNELVKMWAGAHQRVLDEAKKRFGTVIPMGFDTIIRPQNGATHPDQVVKDWLREDYDRLLNIMENIKGRDEYGVQVFYDPSVISTQISKLSEEVKQIKAEIATSSPGMAYMYRQKLEKAIKSQIEKLADEWFRDFYGRIKIHSEYIIVEENKKAGREKVMLINFSCLVAKEKVEGLGAELEGINNTEGFSVRFSGPWPPYSFVAKPAIASVRGG